MPAHVWLIFITILTLIDISHAQTYTSCDPTNVTCAPTPGLANNYYFVDFTKVTSTPPDWIVPTWCRVTYNTNGRQNGAELEFLERYDSQQLYSNFYFLFGRVEFVVQAAPGPGIISDMMTLSDDLDELDWEFRGSLDDEVQTGWFGKGVTGLYNHSITPKIPTPMTQFHTYAFDWTPDRVVWEDDGAVVRTLQASDCIGTANQYPQTPMKLMIGLWDAGDPDHYDPWAAGMTPIPPPAGGYSFYVKSVKIWNNNPAVCYNWTDHSGSWQSIKTLNDPSACGISPTSSSMISSSPLPKSSSNVVSSSSAESSLVLVSPSSVEYTSSAIVSSSSAIPLSSSIASSSTSSSSMIVLSSSTTSSVSSIASSSLASSTIASSNTVSSTIASSNTVSSTIASSNIVSSTIASSTIAYSNIVSSTIASSNLASSTTASSSTGLSPPSGTAPQTEIAFSSSRSSSPVIPSSSSAISPSDQILASASAPLGFSSSVSSTKPASSTQSFTSGSFSSKGLTNPASLNKQTSGTLSSSIPSLTMHSANAHLSATSSSYSIHSSSSHASSTHPMSTTTASTHSPSTLPSSVLASSPVKGSAQISSAVSSGPSSSPMLPITVVSTKSSVHQALTSTNTVSSGLQISATLQASTKKTSVSSSYKAGNLASSAPAISIASSIQSNFLSAQTQASFSLVSSTSKAQSVASTTGVTNSSPLVSPVNFPTATGPITSLLPHNTAIPWRHTLTIVLVLPGPQTLSYSPVVEDLEELLGSLEDLLLKHRSKREITSVWSDSSGSVSQSNLIDAAAHRHNHGHQHDHLHDQHRARDVDNSDHPALTNSAAAGVTGGPFASSDTDAQGAGDEQATATVAGTSKAMSLSDHPVDQSVGPNTKAPALADSQDRTVEREMGRITVPESLLAEQYAVSQPTPAYLGVSSSSNTAANAGTTSVLQRQFSAAERISPFAKSDYSLCAVIYGLWVFSYNVLYR